MVYLRDLIDTLRQDSINLIGHMSWRHIYYHYIWAVVGKARNRNREMKNRDEYNEWLGKDIYCIYIFNECGGECYYHYIPRPGYVSAQAKSTYIHHTFLVAKQFVWDPIL